MITYTPENITSLLPHEVFVFGSNESGIHGAGAALVAINKFGATRGVGFGLQGQSFAIPTKDWRIQTLPLQTVEFYIARFVGFARLRPASVFYVTKIGCGLAGRKPLEMSALFHRQNLSKNIILPEEFWK